MDIINVVTAFINFVALGVVSYQTFLTRKALSRMETGLRFDIKTRYLETLPQSHKIVHVLVQLEQWRHDLIEIRTLLKKAKRDPKILRDVAKKGKKHPRV